MKTAVVTGANAGLGFAITAALAKQDFQVVMACRNAEKAEAARKAIIDDNSDAKLIILPLDLSELSSVEHFTQQFAEQVGSLELLINNAGITDIPLYRNSLGHELQMATNYLGNFALIGRLLPFFNKEAACRIINVGSLAHRFGKLNLADMNWHSDEYKPMKSYARSKLALMTYNQELARRLADSNITVAGAHPGFAATEITRKSAQTKAKSAFKNWLESKLESLIPSPENAARPILMAALDKDVKPGDYYGPGGLFEIAGAPKKAKLNPATLDKALAGQLWKVSEELTACHYLP